MTTRSFLRSTRAFARVLALLLALAGVALAQSYSRIGVINDPDGYTNVRKEPSKKSPVIAKLVKGEKFHVSPTDGAWWPVQTNSGVTGFIDSNRVLLLEETGETSAPGDAAKVPK